MAHMYIKGIKILKGCNFCVAFLAEWTGEEKDVDTLVNKLKESAEQEVDHPCKLHDVIKIMDGVYAVIFKVCDAVNL